MDSSSFDEIFRRFQSVTGTSTQQELADVLGIKQSTISESKKRGTVPPGWFLVLFEMRGVNPDWLKQGKGPIYLRTEDGRYMEPEPAATPLGRGVSLPYYDSDRVQDGVWEPSGTIMLPEPYAGKELRILRITGDSFSPTVRQGAFVGVDTSCVRPSSGSIFAVSVPFEGVVIKRVFCDSDTLLLRTDNPLHPSMSIPLAEAGRLIGRVTWVFKRSEPAEAGPHPALTERGRIFGCAARPVRAFRRNVRRTHGQDTRQASRGGFRYGPASYCPEGYAALPLVGAEACRARKAPHILMATQEPHRLPETLLSPPVLWVRRREKAFSQNGRLFSRMGRNLVPLL
ncbi:MAG: S24 family peptidase [Bilophila wadsworthia]